MNMNMNRFLAEYASLNGLTRDNVYQECFDNYPYTSEEAALCLCRKYNTVCLDTTFYPVWDGETFIIVQDSKPVEEGGWRPQGWRGG